MSKIAHPAFSLDRSEGCEIHQNAFWELQTYLGLHQGLAANEGARGFLYESIESGHHLDTIIERTYVTFPSMKFVRCTKRPWSG